MNSHRSKVTWFVIISVAIIIVALAIYYFQSNLLDTSADASVTYSKLCISGKINGSDTTKCYSNDESDEMDVKTVGETLNLETDESYNLEFTLGNFHEYYTEKDGMQPVYQRCQYIMLGQWGWEWQNCGAMCVTSPVYWLTVGLDTDVFDTDNFSNVSGTSDSVPYIAYVNGQEQTFNVDDSKTITTISNTDLSPAIQLSGYASHKDPADMSEYNPSLRNLLDTCGPDNNENGVARYGGQHSPGDKVSMNFTPKVEYQGNIGGYNANGHKSSGDVYGAGIIVPVNITSSSSSPIYTATTPSPTPSLIPPINDMTVVNNEDGSIEFFWSHTGDAEIYNVLDCQTEEKIDERIGVGFGSYSLKLENLENGSHCYVLVAYDENDEEIARSDSYNITVEDGIVSNIISTSSESSDDSSSDDSTSDTDLSIDSISTLASTGTSIWVNLGIALIIIIITGIIIFRKKE